MLAGLKRLIRLLQRAWPVAMTLHLDVALRFCKNHEEEGNVVLCLRKRGNSGELLFVDNG
jgi:hypothetical protein